MVNNNVIIVVVVMIMHLILVCVCVCTCVCVYVCVCVRASGTGFGNPTSIDFIYNNLHQMVASYTASKVVAFDLETGQSVVNFDSSGTYGMLACGSVCPPARS